MLTRRFFLRIVAAGATVAGLCACEAQGFSPASAPISALARLSPAAEASSAYLYTCQNGETFDCLVYQSNSSGVYKVVRTIKSGVASPLGVVAGKDGRFYVADESGKEVLVYSAGGKKLLEKPSDGSDVPVDVAVYSDELAVANQKNLTFFAKGATKPTLTLTDSRVDKGTGAAFDPAGNCYFSFASNSSGARVDEFKGCKGKPHDLGISAGSPYGIAFDGKGNLYYTSYASQTDGVYVCKGVKSCTRKYSGSPFIDPQYVNFSASFTDVWISDPGNYQYGAALFEIDPSTGKVVDMVRAGISFFNPPTGVAAGPGSL